MKLYIKGRSKVKIIVDAMGGDNAPAEILKGICAARRFGVQLAAVERLDVGRRHPQRLQKVGVGGGQGFVQLLAGHFQRVQLGPVELAGIVPQGGVSAGPHVGDDGVHHRLHILLGPQVPVQDLAGGQVFQTVQFHHNVPSSFWASAARRRPSRRSASRRLN